MPAEPQKKEPVEAVTEEVSQDGSWAEDQEKREYYYDDAHGYEVFVPEDEAGDKPDC